MSFEITLFNSEERLYMKCVGCNGSGSIEGVGYGHGTGMRPVSLLCDRCSGTGKMPEWSAKAIEAGERLKERRIE